MAYQLTQDAHFQMLAERWSRKKQISISTFFDIFA